MSMEIDTLLGKRLKSEAEQEVKLEAELKQKQKWEAEELELIKKLLKPEAERVELIKKRVKSKEEQVKLIEKLEAQYAEWKQKTKLHGVDVVDRDLSKYDDIAEPYIYKVGDFVYKNKAWKESEVAVEEYKKLCDELRTNEYDGIPPPPPMVNSLLALSGGGPYSCAITDDNRPTLTAFSHLALRDYNQRNQEGPTFVFHQLVKCSFCQAASMGYYITFQAKAQQQEDPSNSPAITTFQAIVWKGFEQELPRVKDCKIKI